jgi:hypothetical protein
VLLAALKNPAVAERARGSKQQSVPEHESVAQEINRLHSEIINREGAEKARIIKDEIAKHHGETQAGKSRKRSGC